MLASDFMKCFFMSAEQHKMLYLINVNQITYCLGESKDMRDKYLFFCNDMQLINDGTYNNSRKLKSYTK